MSSFSIQTLLLGHIYLVIYMKQTALLVRTVFSLLLGWSAQFILRNMLLPFFLSITLKHHASHHFNSIQTAQCQSPLSSEDQRKTWFKQLRTVVAERIVTEEERVPSYTSLWRHWLRTCWCAQLWCSSPLEDMYADLLPPESCGWVKNSDGTYSIDWEDPDVQKKIQGTIDFLVKGCTCKKGCKNNRCKCHKRGDYCGPGCECQDV